nr:hypothetical protein [Lachnospiraceae bacterium]
MKNKMLIAECIVVFICVLIGCGIYMKGQQVKETTSVADTRPKKDENKSKSSITKEKESNDKKIQIVEYRETIQSY